MESWLTSIHNVIGYRWDNGYHRFRQTSFLEKWSQKYKMVPLSELIKSGSESYGILTPGNVYSPDNPITYIRATDMRSGMELDIESALRVPEEYYRHKRARLRPNSILLAIKGASIASEKSVVFVKKVDTKTIVNGTIFHFQVKDEFNSYFVAAMLDSEILKGQMRDLQITNNAVSYVDKPSISELRIPLPPRPIQDRIAAVMQEAYAQRREKLAAAEALLGEIEGYAFDALNINPASVKENNRFLKSVSDIKAERNRFDVAFNMGFHKFAPYVDEVKLVEEVATFPKEIRNPETTPETNFEYIDISSINTTTGAINETQTILGVNAPSRARQVVHTDDIIISTVRPTRGAIALIPKQMDNFICSTGFAIVHPKEEISAEYLHLSLRLSTTLEQFGRRSTGTSYPAILEDDIRATLIPVPDKQTQTKIATEVTCRRIQATQLRQEAETVVAEAKARVERMILGEETP